MGRATLPHDVFYCTSCPAPSVVSHGHLLPSRGHFVTKPRPPPHVSGLCGGFPGRHILVPDVSAADRCRVRRPHASCRLRACVRGRRHRLTKQEALEPRSAPEDTEGLWGGRPCCANAGAAPLQVLGQLLCSPRRSVPTP